MLEKFIINNHIFTKKNSDVPTNKQTIVDNSAGSLSPDQARPSINLEEKLALILLHANAAFFNF